MSLKYMSKELYQAGTRVIQGMKDQASKCDASSTVRSLRDSASSSSKQARRFTGAAVDSGANLKGPKNEKLKQAEESLRTVMYLSCCWGPN